MEEKQINELIEKLENQSDFSVDYSKFSRLRKSVETISQALKEEGFNWSILQGTVLTFDAQKASEVYIYLESEQDEVPSEELVDDEQADFNAKDQRTQRLKEELAAQLELQLKNFSLEDFDQKNYWKLSVIFE